MSTDLSAFRSPTDPDPEVESKRRAALEAYDVLDTPPEAAFDDLTNIAADVCGMPIAIISLLDRDRQWFKSCIGLDGDSTPRDVSFCHYTVQQNDVLVIEDATKHPTFATSDLVVGSPGIRFYAGAPLITPDGQSIGALCVVDREPRTLTPMQHRTLKRLAAQVISQLEMRRAGRELQAHVRTIADREVALQRAMKTAEGANRSKSSFLANMSHEIRTPMTAILGFTDLLDDDALPADQRQGYISTIRRNGEYLLTLLNDILDLSKIESGQLQLAQQMCDPAEIAKDVATLMQPRAGDKELDLKLSFRGPMPAKIQSDPLRLRQILINLVSNAIKFTHEGGVDASLHWRWTNEAQGTGVLRFDVRDTGIGIPIETQDQLFQPFSQANATTSRRYGGTGLGLSISKRLAGMLGGDITFESTPGRGSVFRCEFPVHDVSPEDLVDPAMDPVAEASEPTPSTGAPTPGIAGIHVLLAEDGPDNQRLIRTLLEMAGATVTLAENGGEACRAVRTTQRPFDVILMDMQMPEVDGYTATRRLRDAGCPTPIIALTAHAMSHDRALCLAAGCTGYETKPIDRERLVRVISELVPRRANAPISAG